MPPHTFTPPSSNGLLDEAARMEVLRHYAILDTPPENFFDDVAAMAATIFGVPMATITFVDETRQWFKARFGLELGETARSIAFCDQTIRNGCLTVVPDATLDERYADNPLVTGPPGIRFYAGAPLVTAQGAVIGTLVILDTRPRPGFDERERLILGRLAAMVMRELDMRIAAGNVGREIAEKVKARTALRRGEEIFRLALDGSPIGVFTLDCDLVYTWGFNPVCGGDAASFRGRRAGDIFGPEDAALLERLARDAIDSASRVHAQIRCRGPAGTPLHVDYRLQPLLAADGSVEGVVGIAIDVTEETRLKREAALARAKIEAAVRSKSHFLAAASHDLRQPFQAMRLFADILAQRLGEPGQQMIMHRLNEAMRAGEALLSALLEISLLEAGTVQPRLEPVPVQSLTLPLADEFAPLAAEKGLALRHCVPRAEVVTDPTLMARMLRHVVANSVRFTGHGKILIGGRRRGGEMLLQVWDTGIGIPAEELRAVFEPFYQIGNVERDRTRGLGLGLAIVEKTARLLGHGLAVRSQPGRGTVFTIGVPLASKR